MFKLKETLGNWYKPNVIDNKPINILVHTYYIYIFEIKVQSSHKTTQT